MPLPSIFHFSFSLHYLEKEFSVADANLLFRILSFRRAMIKISDIEEYTATCSRLFYRSKEDGLIESYRDIFFD